MLNALRDDIIDIIEGESLDDSAENVADCIIATVAAYLMNHLLVEEP